MDGERTTRQQLRARALKLREQGWSVNDIAIETGVALSTAWRWVQHLPLDPGSERARRRQAEGRLTARASLAVRQAASAAERDEIMAAQARLVGRLSHRELMLVGAAVYWCEGSKAKPWRTQERIVFSNSDPGLISIFVRFLAAMDVPDDAIGFRLYIHETADVAAAEAWWAVQLGVPVETLLPTSLKRHKVIPSRHNVGDDYHGCLAVTVRRGRDLYRRIAGLMRGIVDSADADGSAAHAVRYSST